MNPVIMKNSFQSLHFGLYRPRITPRILPWLTGTGCALTDSVGIEQLANPGTSQNRHPRSLFLEVLEREHSRQIRPIEASAQFVFPFGIPLCGSQRVSSGQFGFDRSLAANRKAQQGREHGVQRALFSLRIGPDDLRKTGDGPPDFLNNSPQLAEVGVLVLQVDAQGPDARRHWTQPPELLRNPEHPLTVSMRIKRKAIADCVNPEAIQCLYGVGVEGMRWSYPDFAERKGAIRGQIQSTKAVRGPSIEVTFGIRRWVTIPKTSKDVLKS